MTSIPAPLTAHRESFANCESCSYGVKAVFNNYLQFPLPKDGPGTGAINPNRPNDHAGALGMGLQTASALTLLFTFLAYLLPIFGAWIADTKIGRYQAIVLGVLIGGLAHIIMRYVTRSSTQPPNPCASYVVTGALIVA